MKLGPDEEEFEGKEALHLDEEHDDLAEDEFEAQAGHANHKCTDVMCLVVFVAAFVGLGFVLQYCRENGDFRRLYHGYNYLGQLCGVDKGSDNQTLGEYLYWCPSAGSLTQLDLKHPICVSSCPSDSNVTTNCVQMPPVVSAPDLLGPTGSFKQTFTYNKLALPTYASHVWGHRYCFPKDNAMLNQITEHLSGSWSTKVTTKAGQIAGAYAALIASGVMACVLSMVFLCILNYFACCIVVVCLVVLILGSLISGGFFVYAGFHEGLDGYPSTGDAQWDKVAGFSLLIIGALFALLAGCCMKSIKIAVAVIKTACQCIFSLPSLLLEPLINVIFKVIALSVMLVGFFWLLSCGTVQKVSIQEYAMAEIPGSDLSGVFRSFHYKEDEYKYIAYYSFMIFWVMELCTAYGQYVVSYAVQIWYFTPYDGDSKEDVPCCPILGGYMTGTFYHLGSLAFGSFIVAVVRLVRAILGFVQRQLKGGNPAMECCAKCCQCCLYCFQTCIEFLNKNAYMDIAITSNNFCTAAKRAFKVIATNVDTVAVLNGACWVICWAGLGAITAASCYLTWLMLRHMSQFSEPTGDHFVDDPILVTIASGLISAYIARSFMHVFDTVADCILYCYCIEKIRRGKGQYAGQRYAPESLDRLVKDGVDD